MFANLPDLLTSLVYTKGREEADKIFKRSLPESLLAYIGVSGLFRDFRAWQLRNCEPQAFFVHMQDRDEDCRVLSGSTFSGQLAQALKELAVQAIPVGNVLQLDTITEELLSKAELHPQSITRAVELLPGNVVSRLLYERSTLPGVASRAKWELCTLGLDRNVPQQSLSVRWHNPESNKEIRGLPLQPLSITVNCQELPFSPESIDSGFIMASSLVNVMMSAHPGDIRNLMPPIEK